MTRKLILITLGVSVVLIYGAFKFFNSWGGLPPFRLLYAERNYEVADYSVSVTVRQWSWQHAYRDKDLKPFSLSLSEKDQKKARQDKEPALPHLIVLPLGQTIKLNFTSKDVIHSWSVPGLGGVVDVIPGRLNEITLTPTKIGDYPGTCTELCGKGHDQMAFTVRVVPLADFKAMQAPAVP